MRRMQDRLTRTETTQRVVTFHDLVNSRQGVGLLTGPAGAGKTSALKLLLKDNPHEIRFMTMNTTTRSVAGFLLHFAHMMGIRTSMRSERELNFACHDAFVEDAEYGNLISTTVIVDEAQHADERTLRHILTFNDDFGLPILLAGNEEVLKRSRSSAAAFAQIATRISYRLELGDPTHADVQAFCIEYNVDYPDQPCLISYGTQMSARDFCGILDLAQTLAQPGAVKIEHVRDSLMSKRGAAAAREFIHFASKFKRK